jgi:hypothetical protein
MKPDVQGTLDGLCAIYSIVNAARIISRIEKEASRDLFHQIIMYLENTRDLGKVLTDGVGLTTIGGILRDVVGDLIPNRNMPFKHLPDTPLDEFWSEMMRFLDGGCKRAILVALGGPLWDHWSVVHAISERQIHFFDSRRLRRLNRNRCTTTRSTSTRPHVLCPSHTYFLSQ